MQVVFAQKNLGSKIGKYVVNCIQLPAYREITVFFPAVAVGNRLLVEGICKSFANKFNQRLRYPVPTVTMVLFLTFFHAHLAGKV